MPLLTRPDIFFPDRSRSSTAIENYCFDCPVRRDCEADAKKRDERFGIWGGKRRNREDSNAA